MYSDYHNSRLTLKALSKIVVDSILNHFLYYFSETIGCDISCESSAIRMTYHNLFSLKNEKKCQLQLFVSQFCFWYQVSHDMFQQK